MVIIIIIQKKCNIESYIFVITKFIVFYTIYQIEVKLFF